MVRPGPGVSRNTVALAFDVLALSHAHWGRPPLWRAERGWIRDPDGMLLWITM